MTKVIVFGAHGKIGQRLIRLISSSSIVSATAVVRNRTQAEQINKVAKNGTNITTIELDLVSSSVDDLTTAIKGHSAVVVTAGSAGKDLLKVDLDGVVKTFEASVAAKVRRLVLVSAVFASDRTTGASVGLQNYYIAKHYADRILEHEFGEQLDYTILKPSTLTDDDGCGKIQMLKRGDDLYHVLREDVAKAILNVLDLKESYGRSYDFCEGNLPVDATSTWK